MSIWNTQWKKKYSLLLETQDNSVLIFWHEKKKENFFEAWNFDTLLPPKNEKFWINGWTNRVQYYN